jgi:hypothetical protein
VQQTPISTPLLGVLSLSAGTQTPSPQSQFVKPGRQPGDREHPPSRSALLYSWNPATRGMMIGTCITDTNQVHLMKMPAVREQLTFFPDRVLSAQFEPEHT